MIHRISDNEAEQRSYYRMLHNPNLSIEAMIDYVVSDCLRQVESGTDYLVYQDTTQPSFERNRKNIQPDSGLGVIGDNKSLGFFAHPSLAMETGSGHMTGYADVQCWTRPAPGSAERKPGCKKRDYRREPIEEKESYRWVEAARLSASRLRARGADGRITILADQEGDVFELFQEALGADAYVLVRSKGDRKVIGPGSGEAMYIKEFLERSAPASLYKLGIQEDARKKRKGREAAMCLRFSKVCLRPPNRLSKAQAGTIELWAVHAKELASSVPEGEKPIQWLLLTSRPIESKADAESLLADYALRWNVEQVFRLAKHQGLDIEHSGLERGDSLIKLFLFSLLACCQVAGLHQSSKMDEPAPLKKMFTEPEKACLRALCRKYEGKTEKQKNPYPEDTMQWAYWVLGRLGGWKPHEKRAGVIVLHRGWMKFQRIFEGWSLALDVS